MALGSASFAHVGWPMVFACSNIGSRLSFALRCAPWNLPSLVGQNHDDGCSNRFHLHDCFAHCSMPSPSMGFVVPILDTGDGNWCDRSVDLNAVRKTCPRPGSLQANN